MRLKDCLEFGKDLGMTTVGDAILNVEYHSMMIFKYDKVVEELNELAIEFNNLYCEGKITGRTKIDEALEILNSEKGDETND